MGSAKSFEVEVDVRAYEEDGYLILRGLLPVEALSRVGTELDRWNETAALPNPRNVRYRMKNRDPDGALLIDSIDPVIDLFPGIRELASHSLIRAVLERLYGEPAQLFKDKLVLKPPGVAGFGLHQDYIAWPDFPHSFLTVIVPLDCTTRENGCVEVFPGLQKAGCLSARNGDYNDLPLTAMKGVAPVALELEPGDVAIFGAFLPHRSGVNRTSASRRQLYLSYNRNGELGDYRDAHYETYRRWLYARYEEFGASGYFFD